MTEIENLDRIFNSQKNSIRSKADCVVIAIHTILLNEELLCIGIGEEFTQPLDEKFGTELLPKSWNDNQEFYTLRYKSKDGWNKYVLKIAPAGKLLNVTVVANEDSVYEMAVDVSKVVAEKDFKVLDTAYTDLDMLANSFRTSILKKMEKDRVLGSQPLDKARKRLSYAQTSSFSLASDKADVSGNAGKHHKVDSKSSPHLPPTIQDTFKGLDKTELQDLSKTQSEPQMTLKKRQHSQADSKSEPEVSPEQNKADNPNKSGKENPGNSAQVSPQQNKTDNPNKDRKENPGNSDQPRQNKADNPNRGRKENPANSPQQNKTDNPNKGRKENPGNSDQQSLQIKTDYPNKGIKENSNSAQQSPQQNEASNSNSSKKSAQQNLPTIGEMDRNPLGGGQGTMHHDPFELEEDPKPTRPRNKNKGFPGLPPGAKHDPLSPIKGPDLGKPNPDHFKPPDDL